MVHYYKYLYRKVITNNKYKIMDEETNVDSGAAEEMETEATDEESSE